MSMAATLRNQIINIPHKETQCFFVNVSFSIVDVNHFSCRIAWSTVVNNAGETMCVNGEGLGPVEWAKTVSMGNCACTWMLLIYFYINSIKPRSTLVLISTSYFECKGGGGCDS